MNQYPAEVINISEPIKGLTRNSGRSIEKSFIISFRCPEIAAQAKPGHFVMVNCDEKQTLPRPFSINRINDDTLYLYIAILENGKGTEWLYNRKKGEQLKILGPLGNGFNLSGTLRNVLLIGGGMGIAPLIFLAEQADKSGIQTNLLYGVPNANWYDFKDILPGINPIIATEDGSEGYHGLVTDLIPNYIDKVDSVFVCGPEPMYRYLSANRTKLFQDKPVQVSLESRMACGRGICYGCTIQTRSGLRRVCEHGPVFDIDELLW